MSTACVIFATAPSTAREKALEPPQLMIHTLAWRPHMYSMLMAEKAVSSSEASTAALIKSSTWIAWDDKKAAESASLIWEKGSIAPVLWRRLSSDCAMIFGL